MGIGSFHVNLNFTAMRTNQGQNIENALAVHLSVISSFGYPDLRIKLTGHLNNLRCNSGVNTKLIGNNEFLLQDLRFSNENDMKCSIVPTSDAAVS